jgi:hypothetical protein
MFEQFDVHGSVHLGNVYVRLNVQPHVHAYVCILYFIIFALHVSGAICTHHQEHKLQSTAIGMRNGYGQLDRAKSVRVSQSVLAPMD